MIMKENKSKYKSKVSNEKWLKQNYCNTRYQGKEVLKTTQQNSTANLTCKSSGPLLI